MTHKTLHAAYGDLLVASNRLTNARAAVHRLKNRVLPHKRAAVVSLCDQLCQVQGEIEGLLEQMAAIAQRETTE